MIVAQKLSRGFPGRQGRLLLLEGEGLLTVDGGGGGGSVVDGGGRGADELIAEVCSVVLDGMGFAMSAAEILAIAA